MQTQTKTTTPTSSQFASAACHMDRRADWRTVRIDSVRYVVLQSGNSERTYFVRADAAGCGCLFYERTGRQCSHMLSLELDAMEQELREEATVYEILFPRCRAVVCQDLADTSDGLCDRHASELAYAERLAAKRAAPRERMAV